MKYPPEVKKIRKIKKGKENVFAKVFIEIKEALLKHA